jgi:serine phosphatase RsbU (regulator of sigma subunit)
MPAIRIRASDGSERRVPILGDRVTIGRARDSDIPLEGRGLSRHHAEICRTSAGLVLRDLGSRNGTRLNGKLVRRDEPLRPGDVIGVGRCRLTLSGEEAEASPALGPGLHLLPPGEVAALLPAAPVPDAAERARSNRILTHLTRAATALHASRTLPDLFELVLDELFAILPAQRGCIGLLEGHPPQPVIKASRTRHGTVLDRVSRTLTRRVVSDRVSMLIPRVMDDAELAQQDSVAASGVRSVMCAPLWLAAGSRPAVIGFLYLDSLEEPTHFTAEDLEFLTALANLVAIGIETSRLQEEGRDSESLRADLRRAAEIQANLLPRELPALPGYEIVASSQLCRAVGGDYYDFLVDRGRLFFALGDVSGKGTGAALLMAMLRAAVRSSWTEGSLSEGVARANQTLCQTIPESRYASLFLGCLDPGDGRFTFVNAGHYPPVAVRADGRVEALGEGGPVLGVLRAAAFVETTSTLAPGEALVLFSDGVVEARDALDQEFGQERIASVVAREREAAAARLHDQLLRELDVHLGGEAVTDDRTLVVVKRRGRG